MQIKPYIFTNQLYRMELRLNDSIYVLQDMNLQLYNKLLWPNM